jgi:hypothetical protein
VSSPRVPVSRRSWRRRERPGFTSHTVYPPQREYPSRHRAKTTLWEQSPWLIFRSSLWRWGSSIDGDERNSKVDRGHDYWPSQDQERTSLDCARRAVDPAPSVESLRRLLCRPRTPAQFVPWRPLDPAELREKQGALRCQVGVADYVESRLGQFVNAKRPGSSYFLGTAFPAYSG